MCATHCFYQFVSRPISPVAQSLETAWACTFPALPLATLTFLHRGQFLLKWVVPQISGTPVMFSPLRQKHSSSSEHGISVKSFRVLIFCFHWEFSAISFVISMIVEISGPSVGRCAGMSHDYGERMKTHWATCDKLTSLNGAPAIFFSPLGAHSSLIIPLGIVSLVINPSCPYWVLGDIGPIKDQ